MLGDGVTGVPERWLRGRGVIKLEPGTPVWRWCLGRHWSGDEKDRFMLVAQREVVEIAIEA